MSRRHTRRSTAGVTLMELLIAISLLSLLSVGVLLALRVGLNAMEKTNDRLMSNRRVSGAQKVLEQQIAGMIVTTADCGIGGGLPGTRLPFFQGQPQTMRFVSSYSMSNAHRGYPQILEYQVIPRPDGDGVRLVVNERLYSGPYSTGMLCIGPGPPGQGTLFRPVEIGSQSFVLADDLSTCRFAYLGVGETPGMETWMPVWSQEEFPLAIRVEMVRREVDPAGIPLLSLTVPVHVNRIPEFEYED
jgi:hypothetical protein